MKNDSDNSKKANEDFKQDIKNQLSNMEKNINKNFERVHLRIDELFTMNRSV